MLITPWFSAKADVDSDFGVWGAVQGQGRFTDSNPQLAKWQWWVEGQGRFFNDAKRFGQSLVRPGLGYKVAENTIVWLGYAWIHDRPQGRPATDENRIWQQLSWNHAYYWGSLFSRTRAEQRFLNTGDDVGWRFRQFIKYTHPLFFDPLYVSVWDEIFVNLNSTDWGARNGFNQNRGFAGVGLYLDSDKHFRFELGYLNQFINNRSGSDRMNHIISSSLFMRF